MSSTTSPKTRTGRHAAPMGVLRLITDRAYKKHIEGPDDWGRHRDLTHGEQVRAIIHRDGGTEAWLIKTQATPQ